MKKKSFLIGLSLSAIILFNFLSTTANAQTITPTIETFINEMSQKYHMSKNYLRYLFTHAIYLPRVKTSLDHPAEKKPWEYYQRSLVSAERINNGVLYWRKYAKTLAQLEKQYGVDAGVLVAIIGIESSYGSSPGKYQELGALTTLAFDHPNRSKFFKSELREYLLLTREKHLPPLEIKGSYAGALGIPQFMPSSYRRFAVDFAKNRRIDLLSNHVDAMASIANYLSKCGWKREEPIAIPVTITQRLPAKLLSNDARPRLSLLQLTQYGIQPSAKNLPPAIKAALIALQKTHDQEYWVVFPNFRAIMSYNANVSYAMAVYQLSRAIRESYEKPTV